MDGRPEDIDSCRYLYLRELSEPETNLLRLVLDEAGTGSPQTVELGGAPMSGLAPITHEAGHRTFEIVWSTYIAYSVRNESYTGADEAESYEGRLFVRYHRSHYLDFVKQATFADDQYPGPFGHWGIFCLDHTLDIVSMEEPQIRLLDPS